MPMPSICIGRKNTFSGKNDFLDRFRMQRYPLDLQLATRDKPLFVTAHNLLPHNRGEERGVFENVRDTIQQARAVFVHSKEAGQLLSETFGTDPSKNCVIPHGEQSVAMPPPLSMQDARELLDLPLTEKICLSFGTISPYKGIDEVLSWWRAHDPECRLVVLGRVFQEEYAHELRNLAANAERIDLRVSDDWISDEQLSHWLCAANCTVFNYRSIFTSGAAALARSFGVPILIPQRLSTVDLEEPHSHVLRFEGLEIDFADQLQHALSVEARFDVALDWRESTSWSNVARITEDTYRQVLGKSR